MRLLTVLVPAAALLVSTSASALEFRPFVFVDAGMASVDLSGREAAVQEAFTNLGAPSIVSSDETGFAFMLGVGAQFNQYLGVELGLYDLGKFESSGSGNLNGQQIALTETIEASGYGLRGVGHLPITSSISLEGSVGLAQMRTRNTARVKTDGAFTSSTRDSSTDMVVNVGLGASYRLTEALSFRASVMVFNDVGDRDTTGQGDIRVFTLGTRYAF